MILGIIEDILMKKIIENCWHQCYSGVLDCAVNQTNTCRAKQLESNSNLQRDHEQKQQQGSLNHKTCSKVHHYDFD